MLQPLLELEAQFEGCSNQGLRLVRMFLGLLAESHRL